jgi:hypothetical protein
MPICRRCRSSDRLRRAGVSWFAPIEHALHQIPQLLRGEVLAFHRRREAAVAIDDGRLQRVRDQSFVGKVLNAERVADALDLRRVAGEKVPARSTRAVGSRVARERLGRVVFRIEAHRQQDELAIHPRREPIPNRPKILRHPRAVIGQRTARVDERHRDDFPLQRSQRHSAARFIGQLERRDRRADRHEDRHRGRLLQPGIDRRR